MKKSQNNLTDAEILRQKAEEQLKKQQSKVSSLSSENDLRKLAHELQVHQIELEMQYEQLKQAKEEADAATQKYTELYDFAPSGFFTLSKLGEITGLNLHGASLLGKERLCLINRRFGSSVSDQTKSIFNNFLDKVFTSKIIESCEVTLTTGGKNAQTNVYLTGHVLINGEQCQISVVDITKRKQIEEELKNKMDELTIANKKLSFQIIKNKRTTGVLKSQHLLLTALLNSPSDFFIFSLDNNYCYTAFNNKHREEIKRIWDADIKIGMNMLDCMRIPELRDNAKKSIDRALIGEVFTEIQLQPDFDIYYEFSWNPIFQNKLIIGVFVFTRDITDRIQAEAELIRAKGQAEESNHLKSAFLANMSHEIRTPMNGILGFTELLKKPNLTGEEQQEFIGIIQISGARMLNTINNIVDFSKIESGQMKVDIKESNINEQIEFLYAFFKPEVESKGMQFFFKISLPSKEAFIKTDIEKIYAILTSLIKNAIKFTYEGSIEFGYEKKGEYLEFFVKDTGVGIPQKQQQMIFERFRQGDDSYNRGYEGSGLGLSIAKFYVEMLGGEICVESEEGKGSIFYFTIPYNAVSEEKIEILIAVPAEHKEVQVTKLKILVVEDDEPSYFLMRRMLQKSSDEVLHAKTGVEAIAYCHNNPDLDLVLMDIKMPGMDGYEATRQIRQFNKDVIIIAQTAYAFSGDKELALEAGCNDYISKPINKALLFELIKKHCMQKPDALPTSRQ